MILRKWEDLPENMKNESVRKYYDVLNKKSFGLFVKRQFDMAVSIILLIILSPAFLVLGIAIKMDSKGPVMFRQVRVTQYGKRFRIFKFRTMATDTEKTGILVTTKNDSRVTRVGRILRKFRLDEIPQLFNIVTGDMSLVGTRPEVIKYFEQYTDEMMATLLLPAGVTSEASIQYKDEERQLAIAENADEEYVNVLLPEKMKYNLGCIMNFSFYGEIKTMIRTVLAIVGKVDDSPAVEFIAEEEKQKKVS